MFKYISLSEQSIKIRNENNRLKSELDKSKSYIDYIAMMFDIELPDVTETVQEEGIDEQI